MVAVGRPINGISINGNEWLLDDDDKLQVFPDKSAAVQFLKDHGVSDDEMDYFTFDEDVDESELQKTCEVTHRDAAEQRPLGVLFSQ